MKKIYIALMTVAALAAVSCNTKEEYGSLPAGEVMFTAVQADNPESKTILQSDGSVFWSAGDSINLFYGTAGSAKLISNNSEPVQQTTFSGSLGGYNHNGSDYFHAVYPYSAENTFDGTAFTVTLPEVQSSVAGSFADDLFISMARSQDYTLQFYNLCGGVKFSVAEAGIKYVTFKGNNNEPLAGKVNVIFNDDGKPVVQTVVDGKTELCLDAPDGGTFEPGEWYYIVSLPATLSAGYTMTFYKDEKFAERITDTSISIKRAVWGRLTNANDIPDITPPNNEIWYTSTDGNIVPLNTTYLSEFDANVVSNTYENGKGVIQFDGPITRIATYAFRNCSTLESVTYISNTVTDIRWGAFMSCSNLESVVLPDHLQKIGGSAFFGTAFSTIELPNTLEYIDIGAFEDCALEEITIPESVTYIGATRVFGSRTPMKAFYGKGATQDHSCLIWDGYLRGITHKDQQLDFVVPEGVRFIDKYLFDYYCYYRSITFPESLEGADFPFSSPQCLSALYGSSVSDDHRCLILDGKLVGFAHDGLESETYTVPQTVTVIGNGAFYNQNNDSLKELIIPETVVTLEEYIIGLTFIERIQLPASLKTIGDYAFFAAYCLESITIPAGVESIGREAFAYAGVGRLGGRELGGLTFLPTVPPTLVADSFKDLQYSGPFYVPAGSVEAYKAAPYWNAYAERIQAIPDNTIPEAVDLGLPSGLKWASFNVGASAPEDFGDYFAWGETEPYYTEGHSQDGPCSNWKDGKSDGYEWESYKWYNEPSVFLTKYNTNSLYGAVDNKSLLELEDDVARTIWGSKWRMPTDAEWTELRTKCTWTWTTQNGVNGRLVTGPNGNNIFLPAAGYRVDTRIFDIGTYGNYWSSFISDDPSYSQFTCFRYNSIYKSNGTRYLGHSVRPVSDEGVRVSVTNVSLDNDSLNLTIDETATLTATVTPSNATQPAVIWSSSDASVASVDYTGKVTAVAAGSATITAKTYDGGYTATCTVTVNSSSPAFVPEAVDLGLPSGLKWASCNVGASAPEEYGDYFAWGETAPYYTSGHSQDISCSNWENNKTGYNWASYKFELGTGWQGPFSKYVTENSDNIGNVDNNTELDPDDDAAAINWGGTWRMPTDTEWTELRTECNWTWTTQNGVNGYLITGTNQNSIFLPAAGYRYDSSLSDAGSNGDYWSSSLTTGNPNYAWGVYFYSGGVYRSGYLRYHGQSVRPVTE